MIKRFNDFIESNGLFLKEDSLLLALSGGADSVALFYLLKESGFTFSVAHVNYALRGKESNDDASFVSSLCEKHGIQFHSKEIESDYWRKGMNTQAEARKIRYEFFDKLILEKGYSSVLTAHHKDDNTETILMNITRGTGLKGLMGLARIQGNIVRPLLFAEREEIESYLKTKGIEFREDSSNSSDKYKRNRFRNEIIPLLKKENPSLNEALERLVENLTNVDASFINSLSNFKKTYCFIEKDEVRIETSSGVELPVYLYDVLNEYNFNRDQVVNILSSINEVGKTFISGTHELFIDRNQIVVIKKNSIKDFEIEIFENTSAIIDPIKLTFSTLLDGKIERSKGVELFDKDKLHFPLIFRRWKEGDRIQPLGMKGSKKISDILIDKKIDRAAKQKIMVLTSKDDVICIPGVVLSEKFKVDSRTKMFWRLELLVLSKLNTAN